MEEKELWMNKLKEKLADYSEPAPASGWEQLEKELMPPVEKKIYPYRRWMMAAAAVILLTLVSSVSLYFLGTPAADQIRHTQTPALASVPDALPASQQPDVKAEAVEPVLHPVANNSDRLVRVERNTSVDKKENANLLMKGEDGINLAGKVVEENKNGVEEAIKDNKEEITNREAIKNEENKQNDHVRTRPRRPSGRDKLHIPVEKSSSKKGTWSMGLSVGNSGGTSTEVGAGAYPHMSRVNMSAVSNGLMEIPSDQTLVFEGGVPYLRQVKQVIDVKHHQPISVGFSVRKKLPKGFSLETGLTYTLLSSDLKVADTNHEIEQKLHYVGLPLRANWNFLDKKLITLYVSGGGMIEKCVYGKQGSEKETVKPLQFSVSGAVGAQLNATKHVGLYVEPGVAYFFDDGSEVPTIRKENPFNFNVQAGIRFTY